MPDAAPEPVAAELAAIRERSEHLRSRYGYVGGLLALAGAQDDTARLLAAVEAVLELHVKMDKPARYYEHCPVHAFDPETRSFGSFETVRTCPDCTYREVWLCKHCECPNDEWPCPTYQAISAGLSGKEDDRG